jgi:hypothetical protein
MNDRRIAEWLTMDPPPERPSFDEEDAGAPGAGERSSSPVEPPAPRPAALRNRRRASTVLGLDAFEGHDARILDLIDAIGRRIRRRPLASIAVGVGLGFLIGGALSFRAGRILLAAGARRAARELLKQVL